MNRLLLLAILSIHCTSAFSQERIKSVREGALEFHESSDELSTTKLKRDSKDRLDSAVAFAEQYARLTKQRLEAKATIRTKASYEAMLSKNIVISGGSGAHWVGISKALELWQAAADVDSTNPGDGIEATVSIPEPTVRKLGRGDTYVATISYGIRIEIKGKAHSMSMVETLILEPHGQNEWLIIFSLSGEMKKDS